MENIIYFLLKIEMTLENVESMIKYGFKKENIWLFEPRQIQQQQLTNIPKLAAPLKG